MVWIPGEILEWRCRDWIPGEMLELRWLELNSFSRRTCVMCTVLHPHIIAKIDWFFHSHNVRLRKFYILHPNGIIHTIRCSQSNVLYKWYTYKVVFNQWSQILIRSNLVHAKKQQHRPRMESRLYCCWILRIDGGSSYSLELDQIFISWLVIANH